jgi:hypothetical protein
MTRIIALLLVLGEFHVSVETSRGSFEATYPDTDVGVTAFMEAITSALENESGRFFPCVVYDGPPRDVFQSPMAMRIGLTTAVRTGQRQPGTGSRPSLVGNDAIKSYMGRHPDEPLSARTAEKICLAVFPKDYLEQPPGGPEFFRRTPGLR